VYSLRAAGPDPPQRRNRPDPVKIARQLADVQRPAITSDRVYLAWSVVTAVGIAGLVALRLRWHAAAALFIAVYGAFGVDGLAHYSLALCSEHTFMTNVTIWSEAISGLCLLLASAVVATRQGLRRLPPSNAVSPPVP